MSMSLKNAPKPGDPTEPTMRLLLCKTCSTVDEVPNLPDPEQNELVLQLAIDRHPNHQGRLFDVPLKYLMVPKIKEAIVKQLIGGSSGLEVFSEGFYDTRNQFGADAMRCFGQHGRPQGMCPDFMSDKKRLLPATKAERKDVGLDYKSAPVIHLCSFCPVKMYAEMRSNAETGISN